MFCAQKGVLSLVVTAEESMAGKHCRTFLGKPVPPAVSFGARECPERCGECSGTVWSPEEPPCPNAAADLG